MAYDMVLFTKLAQRERNEYVITCTDSSKTVIGKYVIQLIKSPRKRRAYAVGKLYSFREQTSVPRTLISSLDKHLSALAVEHNKDIVHTVEISEDNAFGSYNKLPHLFTENNYQPSSSSANGCFVMKKLYTQQSASAF